MALASSASRLLALDSLRGVFAVMIVLLHTSADWHLLDSPLIRNGYIGVDFFFALSGFVIAKSYGPRLENLCDFVRFIIVRLGRLWPLHGFMMGMFLLYYGAMYYMRGKGPFGTTGEYSAGWIWGWNVREALFLNAFMNEGRVRHLFANFPAWSINAEFWAYVSFGLIMCVFSGSKLLRGVVFYGAATASALVVVGAITPPFGAAWGWSLFRAIFFFACGTVAFRVWEHGALAKVLGNTGAEMALVAGWIVVLATLGHLPAATPMTALLASLMLVSFAYNKGAVSRQGNRAKERVTIAGSCESIRFH